MNNDLTDRQIQLGQILADLGYEGSWWCPQGQDITQTGRVYLNTTRRDAKVWIEFQNSGECSEPRLKIRVTSDFQPKAWCIGQERSEEHTSESSHRT